MRISKKQKEIISIVITVILLATGMILEHTIKVSSPYIWLSIFLPAYLLSGYKPIIKAVKNIFKGEIFDENFLMMIASIGALILGKYSEAVAVMLFYNVGELFQSNAMAKSRKSIAEVMDIRPDYAYVKRDGEIVRELSEDVKVGEVIVVKAGEKIALDGKIISGETSLNMAALTGESLPVDVQVGSEVLSGSINLSGVIEVLVEKEQSESTATKIIELIENAGNNKSVSENFITKFARYYTPCVVVLALIFAIIPPLVDGAWSVWVYRALTFLVISCPCAVVISVPLSFFGAIGNASKQGILVKGGGYLEKLSKIDVFAFDKTGTLTKGNFEVIKSNTTIDKNEFSKVLSSIESYSNHPISLAISRKYSSLVDKDIISDVQEISGSGMIATYQDKKVVVGKRKLLVENNIDVEEVNEIGSIVYMAIDNKFVGYVVIQDELKPSSVEAIASIKAMGKRTVMLTGDNESVGNEIKEKVGLDKAYCNLLPKDKLDKLEEIIKSGKKVCYTGDGINDAPVLKRADIGIAMGGVGSDIAVETADIVFMKDDLSKINDGIKLSKKTMQIVTENIVFSLGIKLVVLILSALGITNMWLAIFSDVGVSVLAILNAIRLITYKVNK